MVTKSNYIHFTKTAKTFLIQEVYIVVCFTFFGNRLPGGGIRDTATAILIIPNGQPINFI